MDTRRMLVLVSTLGVAAATIAVAEGAWISALALYGLCIAGLLALLARAVRRHRTESTQPRHTGLRELPPCVINPTKSA